MIDETEIKTWSNRSIEYLKTPIRNMSEPNEKSPARLDSRLTWSTVPQNQAGAGMMARNSIATVLLAAFIASCATPPKQTSFDNSQTYDLSKDRVWESLLSFFTSNNIQIKTIEKDSGVIYAERSSVDRSMADCGEVPLAAEIARSGTLNVFVRPVGARTQVTVNSEFKVIRMFDNQTFTAPCNSTGLLERSILESIK